MTSLNGETLFDPAPFALVEPVRNGESRLRSVKGAVGEHLAIVELLARGHKVAVPVVDDDGVDLVVDYRLRVQVKTSARADLPTFNLGGGSYGPNGIRHRRQPPDAHVILCYWSHGDVWWVIPTRWLREAGLRHGTQGFSLVCDVSRGFKYGRISDECRGAWHLLSEDWA